MKVLSMEMSLFFGRKSGTTKKEKGMILVKIGRMGGKITEYAFEDGTSIEKAFQISGVNLMSDERYEWNSATDKGLSWILADRDRVLIMKKAPTWVNVKVGRIGEKLMEIKCHKGDTINSALISAGRLPFPNEEIWIHWESTPQGTKGALNTSVSDGMIIVLEKPATLRDKLYKIVSYTFQDENGEWEEGTNAILAMLNKDYKLS